MKFLSLCSGIEAASVAFAPLGWTATGFCEIEAFPSAVLAHHHPEVTNFGDMTGFASWPVDTFADSDLIVGGPPCQAFSVAGKRESLNDDRGNLTLTYVDIINHADAIRLERGRQPIVALYENVPGILNTPDNAFGCFLGALAGADDALVAPGGRWSDAGVVLGPRRAVAWRILDAQFFGLAQRRRRVFVVASARDGFDPGAVLLEFDGLRRDSAPRREAREETTSGLAARAGGGGRPDGGDGRHSQLIALASGQAGAEMYADGSSPTLTCLHEAPIVAMPTSEVVGTLKSAGGHAVPGNTVQDAMSHQLIPMTAHTLRGEGCDASEDGTGRGTPLVAVSVALRGREGGAAAELGDDCAFTLRASEGGGDKPHVLAFSCKDHGTDVAPTLRAMGSTDGRPNGGGQVAVAMPFRETADCLTSAYGTKWNGNASADNGSLFVGHPVAFHCDAQADQLPGPETDTSASASASASLTCSQRAAVAIAPTITATNDPSRSPQSAEVTAQVAAVHGVSMQVRRLTPRECERLQGFQWLVQPDYPGAWQDESGRWWSPDYTAIPWRKKPAADCPDGPRYKALGNSWAVPCVRWIGARIDEQLRGHHG